MPSYVLTTGPFSITTPENATLTNGVVNVNLSGVQTFGPVDVSLVGATARSVRWRPGFAGTLRRASAVLSGAAIATGAATLTVGVAGVSATTDAALTFAVAAVAGAAVDVAVTTGGSFTADQTIDITVTGTNTASSWAGVLLEYVWA